MPTIIIILSTGLSLLGLILWRFFLISSNVGLVWGKKLQHLDINCKKETIENKVTDLTHETVSTHVHVLMGTRTLFICKITQLNLWLPT